MGTPIHAGLRHFALLGVAAATLATSAWAAPPPAKLATASTVGGRPPELGAIEWLRDFEAATNKARSENKPLLVLFQEVPGCGTCVSYGDRVLSHPLIMDAAETLFVPVAVYNNIKGSDEQLLKAFKEPAWNNPVVRIMTYKRDRLAPRVADDYTVAGLATAMATSLEKHGAAVPPYLGLLAEEGAARKRGLESATLVMHCFWEGEGALGTVPGVIATMPGFVQKKEVVEVQFDPATISYASLLKKAKALDCASEVFTRNEAQHTEARRLLGDRAIRTDDAVRPDKQPKYYLSNTPYRHVPMTQLQAARVNAALPKEEDPNRFLSPRQIKLLGIIRAHPSSTWPVAVGADDLRRTWQSAAKIARSLGKPLCRAPAPRLTK